jgi:hypothetical protein
MSGLRAGRDWGAVSAVFGRFHGFIANPEQTAKTAFARDVEAHPCGPARSVIMGCQAVMVPSVTEVHGGVDRISADALGI